MQTAKKFASSEWTSPIQPTPPEVLAQRPKLIITYTPNYSPADFNQDGDVDGFDLAVLLAVWGPCDPCPADLNGDGIINGLDLAMLLGQWG